MSVTAATIPATRLMSRLPVTYPPTVRLIPSKTRSQRGRAPGGMHVEDSFDPAPPVEEHEEGEEGNGDERKRGVGGGARGRGAGTLEPEQTGDAAALVDLDELLAEMEAALEERERAAPRVEFSQVSGSASTKCVVAVTSGGMTRTPSSPSAANATTKTIAAARALPSPRRTRASTAGFRAIAKNAATSTQVMASIAR